MSAGVLSAPSRSVSNSPGVGGGRGGGGSHRDLTAEEQGMVRRRHHGGGGGGGQGGGNVRTRYRTFPEFPAVLCFFFNLINAYVDPRDGAPVPFAGAQLGLRLQGAADAQDGERAGVWEKTDQISIFNSWQGIIYLSTSEQLRRRARSGYEQASVFSEVSFCSKITWGNGFNYISISRSRPRTQHGDAAAAAADERRRAGGRRHHTTLVLTYP